MEVRASETTREIASPHAGGQEAHPYL
jgi:hypothetical protein